MIHVPWKPMAARWMMLSQLCHANGRITFTQVMGGVEIQFYFSVPTEGVHIDTEQGPYFGRVGDTITYTQTLHGLPDGLEDQSFWVEGGLRIKEPPVSPVPRPLLGRRIVVGV